MRASAFSAAAGSAGSYCQLPVLVLLLLLTLRPARAQELTLPTTTLHHASAVWPAGARSGRLTRTDAEHPTERNPTLNRSFTRVRFEQLDGALRGRPTDSVRLTGWCTPMFTATGAHHTMHRFQRRGSDSMISVAVDTAGHITGLRRQLHSRDKSWDYLAIAHPLDGFLLANYNAGKRRQLWVRFLRPDLSEAWVWNPTATSADLRLDTYAADEEHLWLVVTDNVGQRHRETTAAYCLDLRTGREVQRLPLDEPGQNHRSVTACTLDSAHRLLVAGQAFDQPRPASNAHGDLFSRCLSADGTRGPETRTDLTHQRTNRHIHWHHVDALSAGGVRVVGETYTVTSKFVHHVRYWLPLVLTVGRLHLNWTTLRPRGVLVAELTPAGKLGSFRSLELPDGGKYGVIGYMPGRSLAVLAAQYGGLRWRGLSPDAGAFLLRSPRRIVRVGLRDWTMSTIATASREGALDVWGYSAAAAPPLVVETARRARSVRFFYAAP